MRSVRWWAAIGSAGLVASVFSAVGGIPAAGASRSSGRSVLNGSVAPAAERAHSDGSVPKATPISFDVTLALRDLTGAQAEVKAVSDPTSSSFHHYLTDAQWVTAYGPTRTEVNHAESWLRKEGFSIGAVPNDRLFIPATGTAGRVGKALSTTLSYHEVNGNRVILADSSLSVPSSVSASVSGVVGVNQYVETPAVLPRSTDPASGDGKPGQEPPPPPAFVNPEPCSAYWGQKLDTKDSPKLYAPYAGPLPYDICGYTPEQLRSAYRLTSGETGKSVTLAIVDAYDSPTLLSDTQKYFKTNDAKIPLLGSQFSNVRPSTVDLQSECGGSGWYGEQALDVEASHTVAPGAHIVYVGARDCLDASLLAADNTAVTSGASVVSNSWDDLVGDIFEDVAARTAFDDVFMLAASTGVSVLFCSHDDGDNFATFGVDAPNYPASSPYVTSVGGTSLEVAQNGTAEAQYGWSDAFQGLSASKTTNCGSATKPSTKLTYAYGSAGGTSFVYAQPWYQVGVVPEALSERNEAFNGPVPYRVEPDISMDADVQTGMLIGLTEAFPKQKVAYGQYKIGGTSLSSPLFAGVIADADQAAGVSLGFLNPVLYRLYTESPSAFHDIVAPPKPHSAAEIRVDYANFQNASDGYEVSLLTIGYEGPETYCDATGNCATRPVTLTTTKGFDSMTGIGTISPTFVATMAKF